MRRISTYAAGVALLLAGSAALAGEAQQPKKAPLPKARPNVFEIGVTGMT